MESPIAFRICLALFAFMQAAMAADQDGLRVGSDERPVYFVEPTRITVDPDGDFVEQLAAASESAKTAPVLLTTKGNTQLIKPQIPIPFAIFDAWIAPVGSAGYSESIFTGVSDTKWQGNAIAMERFVRDNRRQTYATYVMTVDAVSAKTFRVTFSESNARAPDDLKLVTKFKFPVPQIVERGDVITLDLYSDSRTGQKVFEDIHFGDQTQPIIWRQTTARDVYSDDSLTLTRPRVRKNGVVLNPGQLGSLIEGSPAWIYLPGEGRYTLSLKPGPGFARAGEVANHSIRFTVDRNLFRIDCADRIADAGSGTYYVYVSLDASWQPDEARDRTGFLIGANPKEKSQGKP